jgi:hypothetical protein
MKSLCPVLLAAGLAACVPAPADMRLAERQQRELAAEIGTRVAGAEQSCLPSIRTAQLVRAGGRILYRDGSALYLARTTPGCEAVADPNNALLIEYRGTSELCRGQFLKVVDTSGGFLRGSCSLEGFTPYRKP